VTVENIRNAIIADAEKEAERIREAGRKKCDEKFRRARQALQRNFERRVAEAEQHQQNVKNRAIIALRSSLSMKLLDAKNAAIDQTFDAAVQKVINLPDNGYKELLLKWLRAAPQQRGTLILNERDKQNLGRELVESINRDRAEDTAVTLAEEPGEMIGGFVLRTAKYEIDKSLDSIVAKLKEEMSPEIAAELFGGRIERL